MRELLKASVVAVAGSAIVAAFSALVGWEWVMEFLRAFATALLYIGIPVTVLGVTARWWWPKVLSLWHKLPTSEPDRFKAMYPSITQSANAMHWTVGAGRFFGPTAQLDIDHAKFVASLDALRVPYPTPLRYDFLIQLGVLSSEGNLEDARTLLDRLNPSTKSLTITDE